MKDYLNGKIILASGSARRKEIFEAHGLAPVIMPMDVDETLPSDISPQDAVMYLALKKGLAAEAAVTADEDAADAAVAAGTDEVCPSPDQSAEAELAAEQEAELTAKAEADGQTGNNPEPALIVSADTIVYAKDVTTDTWTIMGKPKDEADAWRMIRSINSGMHKVMTGVALIYTGDDLPRIRRVFYDSTDVYVDSLTDEQIKSYIDSGEPFGKAGGYAIQLGFGKYIDHIDGDYENVVGFPYDHMIRELESL